MSPIKDCPRGAGGDQPLAAESAVKQTASKRMWSTVGGNQLSCLGGPAELGSIGGDRLGSLGKSAVKQTWDAMGMGGSDAARSPIKQGSMGSVDKQDP